MIIVTLDDDELPKPDAGAGSFGGGEFTSSFHVLSKTNSPLVDFRIVVDHGSSMDTARTAGLANLTAAMVADAGSRTMSYSEIQQALFPMAASFSYQVDKEMTVFIGRTHRDNLDAYWKIVSGQLLDPGWRLDDFKRVKAKIVNQIRVDLRTNNDEELGKEVLYERLYEGHRYGRLNLGHVRTLNALTLVDVKRFYASYIRGAPRLGLAGGFDDAFAKRAIEDLAERGYVEDFDVEIANAIPGGRSLTGPKQHRVTIVQKETRATALSFGFHTPVNRRHPDFAALWLARSWLGEHRSSNSHLFQRMREIRGMNYGDYAYVEYFPRGMSQFHPDANLCRRHQIFQVWIRPVPPEQAVYALRIAKYELDKLVKNGLTEEQFTATRSFLSKYLALLVKSQDRQLGYAIDDRWYGMKDYVGTMRERLAGLTLEKVNAAIRRHLTYDGLEIVFIAKDAEGLKAQLVSGAPSPITYDSKKPADILQEDKLIERYPLGLDQGAIHVVDVKTVFE
ncbi:MAG: hypothetical protein CMJ83_18370 [Planctomycetes bacterium]|nr:hypothetical protein [Planctomycetota bacterium]